MSSNKTFEQIAQLQLSIGRRETGSCIPEVVLPSVDQQVVAMQWLLDIIQTDNVIQGDDPIRLKVALLAQDAQDIAKRLMQQKSKTKWRKSA